MGDFSRALVRARREAGFKTAYAFYHNNGGRRHFPFTYVHYLRLEKGAGLPRPAWLSRFLTALRLSPGEAGCRRLFTCYLRDTLGTREAVELVLEPLLCRHGDGAPAAGADAVRWMKAEHSVHLTPAQFQALASSEAAYWCSEVLCGDAGAWTPVELSRAIGLPQKSVEAGLRRLAAAGLARRTPAGRWRARSPGKLYTFPGRLDGMGPHLARIEGWWDKMEARRGAPVSARVEVVRAEAGFMRRHAAALAETVEGASSGAVQSKGDDTALYLVEASVRRLLPL